MSGSRAKKLRRFAEALTPPRAQMKPRHWWQRLYDLIMGRPPFEVVDVVNEPTRRRATKLVKRKWQEFNRAKGGK